MSSENKTSSVDKAKMIEAMTRTGETASALPAGSRPAVRSGEWMQKLDRLLAEQREQNRLNR